MRTTLAYVALAYMVVVVAIACSWLMAIGR